MAADCRLLNILSICQRTGPQMHRVNFNTFRIIFLIALLSLGGCRFWMFGNSAYDNLRKADEAARRKEYDTAIQLYRAHIDYRLTVKDRPEWENPWFYLLQIGDIQLGQNKDADALKSYLLAEQEGVDKGLISDRVRYLAAWYEEHDRLQDAFKLLQAHKDRDPLLFDLSLDRVSKEMVKREDSQKQAQAKPLTKIGPPSKH